MKKNPATDLLLASLKEGDMEAFEQIYARYYERLCIYLLSYTNNRQKAEDSVQEVFLKLWSGREELQITTSLKSYLYQSAYNKLMDTFRYQKRKDSFLQDYYRTALIRAENLDESYKRRQIGRLQTCLDKLPDRCSEVFKESKFSGKKYQQIADELKISVKTVEGHITKAFKLIKICMDGEEK